MSKYFKYETDRKLACSCCGKRGMKEDFLEKVDKVRERLGKPLKINSGYRCSKYNATVSTTGPFGPHTTGRAVDIEISGEDAYTLVSIAFSLGFTGIGIKQKGPAGTRFIHLDDLEDGRPRIWSY